MERPITHDSQAQRFICDEEGQRSVLDYRLHGETMAIVHTGVPRPLEGRGIAAALTRAALDTARKNGWQVDPVCSYAAAYIRRHSEYHDLLD